VLRTGRFGVGALAAFLLGDEIEVTTRHALSPAEEGINFSARLDDETISLHRVNAPIGTRIKIRIPEHSRQRIGQILPGKWQSTIGFGAGLGHYFLQSPSLERTISSRSKPVQPSSWLP
jgi:molecular chaperone HtpG